MPSTTHPVDNLTLYLPDSFRLQGTSACPDSLVAIRSESTGLLDEEDAQSVLVPRASNGGRIRRSGDDMMGEAQRNVRIIHLSLSTLFAKR